MAYSYARLPQCRVCQHIDDAMVAKLDRALLEDALTGDIIAEFGGNFNKSTQELTSMAVFAHKTHMTRAVPSALLEIPDLSGTLETSSAPLASANRSEGFNHYLGTLLKNREMLDNIVASATEDLNNSDKMLDRATSPQSQAMLLAVRDKIRNSLADLITLSKTLISPEINVNFTGKEADRVTELLVLIRHALVNTVPDVQIQEAVLMELASLIRKSQTLKDIFDQEKKSE